MTAYTPEEALHIFESLIGPPQMGWEVLPSDNPLVNACTAYWGRPVEEDARAWQQNELAASCFADADPTTDDDFCDGCYVMPFPPIDLSCEMTQYWIRAEYVNICNHLDASYLTNAAHKSVVLTGQPGIGKTMSIHYMLRRRLGQKQPTAVMMAEKYSYLFCEAGVAKILPNYTSVPNGSKHCWLIVDSFAAETTFPTRLLDWPSLIVFVSPPTPTRWARLKSRGAGGPPAMVYMNSWSRREIGQGACLSPISDELNSDLLDARYKDYGPIPRICFFDEKDFGWHVHAVLVALDSLETCYPSLLTPTTIDTQASDVSYRIALIHRTVSVDRCRPTRGLSSPPVLAIAPLTAYISREMVLRLIKFEQKELAELYQQLQCVPSARLMLGPPFEAYMHQKFLRGCSFKIRSMVRLPDKPNTVPRPQWHTSHLALASAPLELCRKQSHSYEIDMPHSPFQIYSPDESFIVLPGQYYIPSSSMEAGLDSFMLQEDRNGNSTLYIFQFTVAESHDMNARLPALLQHCQGVPRERNNWRFVLVADDPSVRTCRYREELVDIPMYCTFFEI